MQINYKSTTSDNVIQSLKEKNKRTGPISVSTIVLVQYAINKQAKVCGKLMIGMLTHITSH